MKPLALIATIVGASGSFLLMLRVGQHAPLFMIVLFAGWVLAPFVALAVAHGAADRWPASRRTILYVVMLLVAVVSLALYADVVLRPPASAPASRFLLVPLGSWVLVAIALLARRG